MSITTKAKGVYSVGSNGDRIDVKAKVMFTSDDIGETLSLIFSGNQITVAFEPTEPLILDVRDIDTNPERKNERKNNQGNIYSSGNIVIEGLYTNSKIVLEKNEVYVHFRIMANTELLMLKIQDKCSIMVKFAPIDKLIRKARNMR